MVGKKTQTYSVERCRTGLGAPGECRCVTKINNGDRSMPGAACVRWRGGIMFSAWPSRPILHPANEPYPHDSQDSPESIHCSLRLRFVARMSCRTCSGCLPDRFARAVQSVRSCCQGWLDRSLEGARSGDVAYFGGAEGGCLEWVRNILHGQHFAGRAVANGDIGVVGAVDRGHENRRDPLCPAGWEKRTQAGRIGSRSGGDGLVGQDSAPRTAQPRLPGVGVREGVGGW